MKEVYIIRHGQTQYNLERKIQGQGIDAPLNETGFQQSRAFYEMYNHLPFEVIYHSSLQRSYQTIEPFLNHGIRPIRLPELDEISWGDWEGRSYDPEISEFYKRMIGEWATGNLDFKIPNGESARELIQRLSKFWDNIILGEEQLVLVCSHGRALRALLTVIFQEDASEMEKYQHHNTGLFKIDIVENTPHLIKQNNLDHLANVKV